MRDSNSLQKQRDLPAQTATVNCVDHSVDHNDTQFEKLCHVWGGLDMGSRTHVLATAYQAKFNQNAGRVRTND